MYLKNPLLFRDQSVENAGVAFVKEVDKRYKLLEKINNQYCMTIKCGRTRQRTNNLKDELIWGMNSASELATIYYYTRRNIRGGSQSTPPGDKAWCFNVPIKR